MGRTNIRASDIRAKLEGQGFHCEYTGDELTPDNISADHFVPLVGGGAHDLSNIRLVTCEVNAAKNTMDFGAFVTLCRKVVNHHEAQHAPTTPVEDLEREWLVA